MFEKCKLDSQKAKSAEAFQHLEAAKAHADKIFSESEALQPGIETAFLERFACEQSGGARRRLQELDAQYRRLLAERDGARRTAQIALDKAANVARATSEPAVKWAVTWIRDLMQAAPVSDEFSRLCLDAIRDIESGPRPLADVMKCIEARAAEIQGFDFGKKIEKPLPALSIQALAW